MEPPIKLCLVTVGATAPFKKLIYHVLTDEFLTALKDCGFTHLILQYGKDGERFYQDFLERAPSDSAYIQDLGLNIGGFDFEPSLDRFFCMAAKIPQMNQEQGLVVSHAGTGSVLAAMEGEIPLIIVPNPQLADNHQEELADALSEMGYAHKATPETVAEVVPVAMAQGDKRPGTNAWHGHSDIDPMADQLFFLD